MDIKVFFRYLQMSFKDLSVFRSDFVISILHILIYQGIFIIFWDALLGQLNTNLGVWDKGSLALLILVGLVFSSVRMLFFGFTTMSEKVINGDLDKYLCRPISPLMALLAEDTKIWAAGHSLLTCSILFVLLNEVYSFEFEASNFVLFVFSIVAGSLTLVLMEGCIALSAFWFGNIDKLFYLINSFSDFQRYPITLFPKLLQHFLIYVLPIGLVSSVPVMILMGSYGNSGVLLLAQLGLLGGWLLLFCWLWRCALRRYDSLGG
ncbi:ABC-2 family transporter protein [Pseudoalteromonas byunsanensis]|uniref:ABC-2 family transporter protein n=1 Tax=Pseudoalteromonas byunsanensis TaxID=327939 RepID=UPI000A070202|nr:ABC-2 family transporter protein [Pseudoalteromonas byunsanensis]